MSLCIQSWNWQIQPVNKERGRKGKEEEEKGACRNGQGFRFPNDSNLCHIQINCSGRKHNKNN